MAPGMDPRHDVSRGRKPILAKLNLSRCVAHTTEKNKAIKSFTRLVPSMSRAAGDVGEKGEENKFFVTEKD